MKKEFLEVVNLAEMVLFNNASPDDFFKAADAFLSKFRICAYCSEIRELIERVNKKIVFNA